MSKITIAPKAQNGSGPWAFYFWSLPLSIFTHVAVLLFAADILGNMSLFWIWLLLSEGGRLALFVIGVGARSSPFAFLTGIEVSFSQRLLFPTALLYFAYAGAPWFVALLGLATWALQEYRTRALAQRVQPENVLKMWRREGVLQPGAKGQQYVHGFEGIGKLLDRASKGGRLLDREIRYIAVPLAICGPALFAFTRQDGADFVVVAFIAGCLTLFAGYFSLPMAVSAAIGRRALRQLQADGE